jgi:hypothetical protein
MIWYQRTRRHGWDWMSCIHVCLNVWATFHLKHCTLPSLLQNKKGLWLKLCTTVRVCLVYHHFYHHKINIYVFFYGFNELYPCVSECFGNISPKKLHYKTRNVFDLSCVCVCLICNLNHHYWISLHVYAYVFMSKHVYVWIYIYTYIHLFVHMYVYLYVHVYICLYIYISPWYIIIILHITMIYHHNLNHYYHHHNHYDYHDHHFISK